MKSNVYYLCQAAAIAAVYTVLTLVFAPIAFGPIQCRISEMLTVLPAFTPAAIPGLAIGCLLSNILGGAIVPDIIFGSLATLIGAYFTHRLCSDVVPAVMNSGRLTTSMRIRAVLPPILSNTVIVPLVLKYAYHFEDGLIFMIVTVFIGEVISCGIFGNVLMSVLGRKQFAERFCG